MSGLAKEGGLWAERSSAAGSILGDNQSMFRLFFEQSTEPIWVLDPKTTEILDCNAATVGLVRCGSREELLGRRFEDFACCPELPAGASALNRLRSLREGNGKRFECVARRFDGTELPMEVNATVVKLEDRELVIVASRDITEQKAAEEEVRQLNRTLERRVEERTAELVLANDRLMQEVTERARAEVLLRESEERARTLVEYAPEAIVVFDSENGQFLECNENATRLYGLRREELLGRHPAELSPDVQPNGQDSRTAARLRIQQALEGEVPVFEWIHRHASGRLVPCEVRLVRLPAEGRTLIRGSVIDNTERRRQEKVQQATFEISEAVHQSGDLDHLYQRIHGIIKDLMPARNFYIALHDPATKLISFAYHVDEVTPRPAPCELGTGLTGYVFRFGRPLLVDAEMTRRKRRVGDTVTFEGFADIRYVESGIPAAIWLGVPLSSGGKTFGVMAVQDYHDPEAYGEPEKQLLGFVATQVALAIERKRVERVLRESEARFSTAFRASPIFMSIARLSDGRFVEINEALLNWSGYTREEAIGRTSAELNAWVDLGERELLWQDLRAKGWVRDRECAMRTKGGAIRTMEVCADIIELNNEPHLLMVGQDVTQRKQAEEELLRALAREKELGQLRSNFVSMVSHEFRTPLGIIQSSAEILEDYLEQLEPEERQQHLRSIHKNTRRMAGLMEEVLLIGRLEAGKMDYRPVPIDLRGLVRRLKDEVLNTIERRCPIELSLAGAEAGACGDERLLAHIFTNLLTNAVKYSEAGLPVHFAIRRAGEDAIFVVRDQGIGIPDSDREWLFTAFHRGRNVGDRPGTGLGLVIVKRCVDLHGGRLLVESKPGQGTTMTVVLPLFLGQKG